MKAMAGVVLMLAALIGCDGGEQTQRDVPVTSETAAPATTAKSSRPRVVFLGDSLTAGYGIEGEEAFPAIVGQMLKRDGVEIDVVNAGVSGDTTAGGLRRIDWLMKQRPDVVVVGLGGNDGLRGMALAESEKNLREIVTKARAGGAKVLLLGMLIPPNYGPEYTTAFGAIYPRVSKDLGVPLVPFLLKDVGGETKFNQRDGIHPTAEGHKVVAKNVEPHLTELMRSK
jgi:acyl-CoA thioesterase-1